MLAKSSDVEGGIKVGDRILQIDGKSVTDPITLPMELDKLRNKNVSIEVEIVAASGKQPAGPKKITFTAKLGDPDRFSDSRYGEPCAALLSLGVTYEVQGRVTAIEPKSPAADVKLAVGDEIVEAKFVPPSDPQTEAEKLEVKVLSSKESIHVFGPSSTGRQ